MRQTEDEVGEPFASRGDDEVGVGKDIDGRVENLQAVVEDEDVLCAELGLGGGSGFRAVVQCKAMRVSRERLGAGRAGGSVWEVGVGRCEQVNVEADVE